MYQFLSQNYSNHKITTKYGISDSDLSDDVYFCQDYKKFWFNKTVIHLNMTPHTKGEEPAKILESTIPMLTQRPISKRFPQDEFWGFKLSNYI